MQQVKLFKSVEADISTLEQEINEWMAGVAKTGGRIIDVKGNIAPQTVVHERKSVTGGFSPSDLFVLVVYEPGS